MMLPVRLETLFDRYRSLGQPQDLAKVFDRTAPALYRVALQLVCDKSQADDILQDCFIAAIEKAESYDASRPLVP